MRDEKIVGKRDGVTFKALSAMFGFSSSLLRPDVGRATLP